MSATKDPEAKKPGGGFSRRGFIQGAGVGGGALSTGILQTESQAQTTAGVISGETAITLKINGQPHKTTVEPRMTLLDVMRNQLDLTAAKRVCDRGTCGACTVIVDGKSDVFLHRAGHRRSRARRSKRSKASRKAAILIRSRSLRRKRRAAVRLLHARLR